MKKTDMSATTQTGVNMVDHPSHYQGNNGIEVIDVIDDFTYDLEGVEAFDTGNIIKYICRWKSKNGIEDLKKAKWYLEHLIKHVEKEKEKMRFEISATSVWNNGKLLEEYPLLDKHGFDIGAKEVKRKRWYVISDENGKPIRQSHDETKTEYTPTIEVSSLEELLELAREFSEHCIIISYDSTNDKYSLEIYDDYRE